MMNSVNNGEWGFSLNIYRLKIRSFQNLVSEMSEKIYRTAIELALTSCQDKDNWKHANISCARESVTDKAC